MVQSSDEINQKQTAGKNSQQVQVGTVIVNQGITEERARDVFAEMIPKALKEYTEEAYSTANDRIAKLEKIVIPKIVEIDNTLSSFMDPAFQFLLRKAQQTAAVTEREIDYSLLSELILCHIQEGTNRKNRIGISKAMEIVDDIDNDALCALTVSHAINHFAPVTGNIEEGLKVLNNIFDKLMYTELPIDQEWVDHLDVLGAIRVSFGSFKKLEEYYSEKLNGYVCVGIHKDSDEYKKAIELLDSVNINKGVLVRNELIDGYVRLNIVSKESISNLLSQQDMSSRPINETEKVILEKIFEMYSKDVSLINIAKNEFLCLWESFSALRKIRIWWNSIPQAFSITKVGSVLAHTNAKRCDPDLPDLL